jgi:cobaltochelatase CobS|tara:strand:- start:456 stop:1799 length:1344 start_codon:yes stop_codon:yes gene_type:complete
MAISKEKLVDILDDTDNDLIKTLAKDKIAEEFQGDEVAQKMIQLSQLLSMQSLGADIDEDEVRRIVRDEIQTDKITLSDLDDTVKSLFKAQPTTITLNIKQGASTRVVKKTLSDVESRPLVQKLLSDVLARNNSYLYGGAGTGKTFMANTLKKILDWDLVVINCNQFTSALELIGGQTIDGYQEGKVIRAYGNLNPDGSPMGKGCILLLDELPKIDPNTAGILNSALASVGEFQDGEASTIQNAKGDVIQRGDCFIMATGNSLLNTKDAEYEANFKQDLSLQDRFAGSTYEVFVNEQFEWNGILNQQWAFIFIYLTKLRKLIKDEGFTAKAFVSIRLMQSLQKTYNVYRQVIDAKGKVKNFSQMADISFTPLINDGALGVVNSTSVKTVDDSMDEFFSLFSKEQSDILKEKSEYDAWKQIVREKDKFAMDKLNTDEELKEVKDILNS